MVKERKYTLTPELLSAYKENALRNAALLLDEATILLQNSKWSGAYFLACASIEETGKAFLAFNSTNRNLANPAVQSVLKIEFENHSSKILMGLTTLIRKTGIDKTNVRSFLDLNFHLYAGREKSLYADINDDNTLTVPEDIVRPKAATDAVRLANHSLKTMREFFKTAKPQKFTTFDDKFFVVSRKKSFQEMISKPDFWWFLLEIMKQYPDSPGDHFSIAVAKYWDEYYSKGLVWGKESPTSNLSPPPDP